MDNQKKKCKSGQMKVPPRFDNDQLGENASEEYAEEYAQKAPHTNIKKK